MKPKTEEIKEKKTPKNIVCAHCNGTGRVNDSIQIEPCLACSMTRSLPYE